MSEAPEFKPDEAVTLLANFGHDPDQLKARDPNEIKGIYEKTTGFLNTQIEEKLKAVPTFRENWREALAADDPDDLKTLTRFTDPKQLWQRTKELNKKLSSGELKAVTPYPKDGKPEEQAAWRAERGIPAEPAKYMEAVKLKEGLVIGDEDKPFVDDYLAQAHALNMDPAVVNEQLNWYFGTYMPTIEQKRGEMDAQTRDECLLTLNKEWGADYKGNMNAVAALVQTMPEGLRDSFYGARLPDGTAFANSPDVLKFFAGLAREMNPESTLTGTGGADGIKGVNEKIAEYEKQMRTDRQAWNKNEAGQKEYQELLDIRAKVAGKQKAA